MVMRGVGSLSSPIIISDDEDEAIIESQLTDLRTAGNRKISSADVASSCEEFPSTRDLQPPSIAKTVGYSIALRMGFRPGRGLGLELDGRVDPLSPSSLGLKRKRNDSGIGFRSLADAPTNSDDVQEEQKRPRKDQSSSKVKVTNTILSLPNKPPQVKAGKGSAKGKGKRAILRSQSQGKSSAPIKGKAPQSTSRPPGPSSAVTNAIPSMPAGPSHPQSRAQQSTNSVAPFQNGFSYPRTDLPDLWQMHNWLGNTPPPYLPWQGFMNPVPVDHMDLHNHVPTTSHTHGPPPDARSSKSNDLSRSHAEPTPVETSGVSCASKAVPPKKPQPKHTPSIGRGPEADPHRARGTYSKSLSFHPNPSCTIVLDSIPQRYRTVPWVTNWAVNAGETRPVHVDLDSKKGKGLVEFPNANAAHKAFSSKQLRGKGRQAVRAWWYRVVGLSSKSSNEEIEEGEIREDTTTGNGSQVFLPLTRKQKKLRALCAAAGPSGFNQVNGKDRSAPAHDPDPGGQSSAPDRLHVAMERSGQCAAVEVELDNDLNGYDKSSIASSRPPSIRLCATPPPNDMEDMDMSSPMSVQPATTIPSVEGSLPMPTELGSSPHGLSWDGSTSATVVDKAPQAIMSFIGPTINDSPILHPVPQVPHAPLITPDESHDLGPAVNESSQRPPSEPCNPHVAPNLTKQFLLGRQKELQHKIAQSKLALGLEQRIMNSIPSPATSSGSSSARNTPSAPDQPALADKVAMEQDLRRLVLESKKNRVTSPCVTATSNHVPSSILPADGNSAPSSAGSSTLSTLETLAVSFIAESIESAKQPVLNSVPSNARQELALRQERLERYIAKSKTLIAKLNQASNKEEKENILSAMRECSRMMELDEKGVAGGTAVVKPAAFCWPSSCDVTVLEISDDEEDS